MTFFQIDQLKSNRYKYIPTEVNMTLSLKEMTLITAGHQTSSQVAGHVIF